MNVYDWPSGVSSGVSMSADALYTSNNGVMENETERKRAEEANNNSEEGTQLFVSCFCLSPCLSN